MCSSSASQDFTGVPAVVDLACMRDAMNNLKGDSNKINPLVSYKYAFIIASLWHYYFCLIPVYFFLFKKHQLIIDMSFA